MSDYKKYERERNNERQEVVFDGVYVLFDF